MAAVLNLVETAPSLPDRIAATLTGTTTSQDVSGVIRDVDVATSAKHDELARVEARALDPLTPADEVEKAQTDLIRITFDQKRLTAARERLKARLAEVQQAEQDAERRAAYEACKAETEVCAELLRTRYEPLARELADILARCDAVEARQRQVNLSRPEGAEWLYRPERDALGIEQRYDRSLLSSFTKLPDPAAPGQRLIWPR